MACLAMHYLKKWIVDPNKMCRCPTINGKKVKIGRVTVQQSDKTVRQNEATKTLPHQAVKMELEWVKLHIQKAQDSMFRHVGTVDYSHV